MKVKYLLASDLVGELDILNFNGMRYDVYASSEEIRKGFYTRLFDLQGQRESTEMALHS